MKWLDEIRDKEAEINANKFYHAQGDIYQVMPWSDCKESYKNGFDTATKAISEKLKETVDQCSHDADCRYCESLPWTITNCDCWKAKLKELGLC